MCSTMVWLLLVLVLLLGWVGCGLVAVLYFRRRSHLSTSNIWGYLLKVALLGPLTVWMVWVDEG